MPASVSQPLPPPPGLQGGGSLATFKADPVTVTASLAEKSQDASDTLDIELDEKPGALEEVLTHKEKITIHIL